MIPPVIVTILFETQKQTHQQLQWSSRNCCGLLGDSKPTTLTASHL